jgi:REP element-mobilizing transposase RayT
LYIRDPLSFVTCCAYRKRPILANTPLHNAFVTFAERAQEEFGIAVGRYVILPDHLHLFVSIGEDRSLAPWVGTRKRMLAKAITTSRSNDPIWQRGFFDHLMRSAESYSQKWAWSYSGEIVPLAYA